MPESNWVKVEDLALNDEIRFKQEIWDPDKNKWTGRSRTIQGRIASLWFTSFDRGDFLHNQLLRSRQGHVLLAKVGKQLERDRSSHPEANAPASKPNEE